MTPPRCRCCGKPIRWQTVKHLFGRDPRFLDRRPWLVDHAEKPGVAAEVQRLTNQQVVQFRYSTDREYIAEASTWDGESYALVLGHFCTLACAAAFGELAARVTDLQTQRYADALKESQ